MQLQLILEEMLSNSLITCAIALEAEDPEADDFSHMSKGRAKSGTRLPGLSACPKPAPGDPGLVPQPPASCEQEPVLLLCRALGEQSQIHPQRLSAEPGLGA